MAYRVGLNVIGELMEMGHPPEVSAAWYRKYGFTVSTDMEKRWLRQTAGLKWHWLKVQQLGVERDLLLRELRGM